MLPLRVVGFCLRSEALWRSCILEWRLFRRSVYTKVEDPACRHLCVCVCLCIGWARIFQIAELHRWQIHFLIFPLFLNKVHDPNSLRWQCNHLDMCTFSCACLFFLWRICLLAPLRLCASMGYSVVSGEKKIEYCVWHGPTFDTKALRCGNELCSMKVQLSAGNR